MSRVHCGREPSAFDWSTIAGRCTVGSFYKGQCGGTVESAAARSVARVYFGQAETHAEDARFAWHIIVNIERCQFLPVVHFG